MLTSHIATLSSYIQPLAKKYQSDDFLPIINNVVCLLNKAKLLLQKSASHEEVVMQKEALRELNDRVNNLMEQRKDELETGITESETKKNVAELKFIVDQFNFITKIAEDIEKQSRNFG